MISSYEYGALELKELKVQKQAKYVREVYGLLLEMECETPIVLTDLHTHIYNHCM